MANETDHLLAGTVGGERDESESTRTTATTGLETEQVAEDEEDTSEGILSTIVENVGEAVEIARDATVDIMETIAEKAGDVADTVAEVTSDAKDAVIETAGDVKEAVIDEIHDVAENFIEELQDADAEEDKTYFLEMQLTRELSILPGDVVASAEYVPSHAPLPNPDQEDQVTEEAQTVEEGYQQKPPAKEEEVQTPLSAYFLLLTAIVSLSSIGPLLDFQQGVGDTLKVYWRTSLTALVLLPFAANSIRVDGVPHLTNTQWTMLLVTAASYAMMCVFFVWALAFTAVGNALILSNSQSMILLAGKIFVGDRVTRLEGLGAVVAFTGAIFCSRDASDASPQSGATTIIGDIFALGSATAGVAYLVFAKSIRSEFNLYVFMFLIMFIGSLQTLIFLWVAGEPLSFDLNVNHGAFGWMNFQVDRLPTEIMMAIVCNLFGAMGYVRAMHYFDNLVISVAGLLEPVVAELLAFSIGVAFLPGWKGWLGNALVALGTLAVVYQPPGQAKPLNSH